jgi:hypothetical protein
MRVTLNVDDCVTNVVYLPFDNLTFSQDEDHPNTFFLFFI